MALFTAVLDNFSPKKRFCVITVKKIKVLFKNIYGDKKNHSIDSP